MKLYEFDSKISSNGELEYPDDIRQQLLPNQEVKVIIVVKENFTKESEKHQQEDWKRLAIETFFADYSEEDEIYNQI